MIDIYNITPYMTKLPEEVQLENVAVKKQNKILFALLALTTACLIFVAYKEYLTEQNNFVQDKF